MRGPAMSPHPESGEDMRGFSAEVSLSKLDTDLPELQDSVGVSLVVEEEETLLVPD